MSELLPLLFVHNAGEIISYAPPKSFMDRKVSFSYGTPETHGRKLMRQFDEAMEKCQTDEVKRIAFHGENAKSFPVEKLNCNGMVLLDWQEKDNNYDATVLMGDRADTNLKKKIKSFQNNETTKKGKLKNEDLLGNISQITPPSPTWYWKDSLVVLDDANFIWVEVWLAREGKRTKDATFVDTCRQFDIRFNEEPLCFPEYLIYAIYTNRERMEALVRRCANIRQCGACRELSSLILQDTPKGQHEWTRDLLNRLILPAPDAPAVCILDTGCNQHPILQPLIRENMLLSAKLHEEHEGSDLKGHGTSMAGIAAYGNINHEMMNSSSEIKPHPIESCRVYGIGDEDKLYGHITKRAVSIVEIGNPKGTRAYCMAVTSAEHQSKLHGSPSSWSSAIDAITSKAEEEDSESRIFLISSGNRISLDSDETEDSLVQNPAQAWNAITVGASCNLTGSHCETNPAPGELFSPAGGISPHSTHSVPWGDSRPIKPDIVCEGGNTYISGSPIDSDYDDVELIAPFYDYTKSEYIAFNGTSLATALVTHITVSIMREYPNLRAETVRALIIHSAEWNDKMKWKYLLKNDSKGYRNLVRMCGHGEPSLTRAIGCVSNTLTLVHEGTIKPYKLEKDHVVFNEMVYHDLPWPKQALQELGDAEVELKVTLSYYIEPSPSVIEGKDNLYCYPSCSLKFSVRKCSDVKGEHLKKINMNLREKGEEISNRNQYDGWQLGRYAFAGSVHSDIWEGRASDLANMGGIAIIPGTGWWKTKKQHKKYDCPVPYSLIISIHTKSLDVKSPIYQEVENYLKNENYSTVSIIS